MEADGILLRHLSKRRKIARDEHFLASWADFLPVMPHCQ